MNFFIFLNVPLKVSSLKAAGEPFFLCREFGGGTEPCLTGKPTEPEPEKDRTLKHPDLHLLPVSRLLRDPWEVLEGLHPQ